MAPVPNENKYLSSNEKSCGIITKEILSEVLRKDKGSDAVFKSFIVDDFTTIGDNYSCFVTSIKVDYTIKGNLQSTKYVAKINPKRQGPGSITSNQFLQENKFYAKLLPEINDILRVNQQEPMRVPKFYHYSDKVGDEILFLEDMRERGFKLFDRLKGVDELHADLVFKELGRLHAAGKLMTERYGEEEAIAKFNLKDDFMGSEENLAMMNQWLSSFLLTGTKLIANLGEKYQRASQVLLEMLPNLSNIMKDLMEPNLGDKFATIQHGDCWNNNILFRYENGKPIEVCLLDMQMVRYSSVGIDLNYFAYTSFHGPVRRNNLDKFLDTYLDAYKGVLPGGQKCHFSRQELRAEYENKKLYGLLMNLIVLPLIMSTGEDAPDFDGFSEENMAEKLAEYERNRIKSMAKNPNFEPRFVDMVEEMMKAGILA